MTVSSRNGATEGGAGRAARLFVAALLAAATAVRGADTASAQTAAPSAAPGGGGATAGGRIWFDPTQLPSFTGVVERYVMDPDGRIGRLLLREGAQVVFPEDIAAEIQRRVPPGAGLVVWGIRARRAPVITMLAWSPDGPAEGGVGPRFVDRPTWGFGDFVIAGDPMQVSGEVAAPLYTPQGEVMGAILRDGAVVRVPQGVGAALGDRLAAGSRLAAVGRGRTGPLGMALDAERIGASGDALQPLPEPVAAGGGGGGQARPVTVLPSLAAPGAERRP